MSLRRISASGRSSRAHVVMGIRERKAVAGKMLAHRGHAGIGEALDDRGSQRADGIRVEMQCTVADHAAPAVVEVEHRREAEIDAVRAELGADDVCRRACGCLAFSRSRSHGGRARALARSCEAVAEALHPPAFVVDADRQGRLSLPFDLLATVSAARGSRSCGRTGSPRRRPGGAGARGLRRVSIGPTTSATTGPGGSLTLRIPG